MSDTIERELGAISAHLKHITKTQAEHTATFKSMDTRLRTVETRGAISGAITGSIMAVAIGLIKNTFSN